MSSDQPMPEPSLSMLCYSLATQAMVAITGQGESEDDAAPDLAQAKYTIDLLEMLREKTEGNRNEKETEVLMSLLFDLRMRYVEKSRATHDISG